MIRATWRLLSIATTPRCGGARYSLHWIAPLSLDPYLIMLSVKQGVIWYLFFSLWYDSTWEWTQVSRTIAEHSMTPGLSHIKSSNKKWYLIPPCLSLSIIRYGSRIKWRNPRKGVVPFPTSRCCSYWKGAFGSPLTTVANFTLYYLKKHSWRNSHCRRMRTQRLEFKSRARLFAFHIALKT